MLIGDPTNPPVLKASSSFNGDNMVTARYASGDPTTNFFMAIKNVAFDTTNINADSPIVVLDWSTAQACQLTNVNMTMPFNSGGHVGINMSGGSATAFADVVR